MGDHSDQRDRANCGKVDAVERRLVLEYPAGGGVGLWTDTNLPSNIPLLREEIAILKAFLSDEIRAIMEAED